MNGVAAEVTCPICGKAVVWLADGTSTGARAVGMVRCDPCNTNFRLTLTLTNTRVESKSLTSLMAGAS